VLIIRLEPDSPPMFTLKTPQEEGYVIGRSDESSDFQPDIDLAGYGAREMGVSRRHIAVVRFQGNPHILDLGSVNGTFLNGKRLLPDTPYSLSTTNYLRLGTLQLIVEQASD